MAKVFNHPDMTPVVGKGACLVVLVLPTKLLNLSNYCYSGEWLWLSW